MNIHADAETAKAARQAAILELIRERPVRTQNELVAALKERGIATTQASLSRDIAELRLVKAQGRYTAGAAAPAADDPWLPLRAFVKAALTAGPHLVVLKTATGTAQQVGLALDRMPLPGVIGTIAGDDTVFVAVGSSEAGRRLAGALGAHTEVS